MAFIIYITFIYYIDYQIEKLCFIVIKNPFFITLTESILPYKYWSSCKIIKKKKWIAMEWVDAYLRLNFISDRWDRLFICCIKSSISLLLKLLQFIKENSALFKVFIEPNEVLNTYKNFHPPFLNWVILLNNLLLFYVVKKNEKYLNLKDNF